MLIDNHEEKLFRTRASIGASENRERLLILPVSYAKRLALAYTLPRAIIICVSASQVAGDGWAYDVMDREKYTRDNSGVVLLPS